MDSLKTLVTTVRKGNHHAFGEIVHRFQDMAWASAFAQIGDAHLAQDAAQEAFVEAYLKLKDLREPEAFPGWFRRIVFKHADRQRRMRRPNPVAPDVFSELPSQLPDPLTQTVTQEFRASVQDAVAELPEDLRMVTVLFHLDGYSQKEISQFLDVPVSTIKKRLFDGRKQLKERMFDMAKENIQSQKPSKDETFAEKVQFFVALKTNDQETLKRLLEKNAELIHIKTEWAIASEGDYWPTNITPVAWAAGMGNIMLVKFLIAHGADVISDTRPLRDAVLMGQLDVVRFLLSQGVDVNAGAPLHCAVLQGNRAMVDLLIEQGADVTFQDGQERTAAAWGALIGRTDLVDVLVAHGAPKPEVVVVAEKPVASRLRKVPVGKWVLGRLLDGSGKALDEGDDFSKTRVQPLYCSFKNPMSPILDTGIKIIDLFSPLRRGGHNGLFTPLSGVGKFVNLVQIISSVVDRHDGYVVYLGLEDEFHTAQTVATTWSGHGLVNQVATERMVHIFGQVEDTVTKRHQVVETGLSVAESLRQEGHEVLLVLENKLALTEGVVLFLKVHVSRTSEAAITVLYSGDHTVGLEPEPLQNLDSVVTFNRARAHLRLYPAVDPLDSYSTLLNQDLLDVTHKETVDKARRLLARYEGLHDQVEAKGLDALYHLDNQKADQDVVIRARRLHRFLTQPFRGTEPYTGVLGERVALADTIKGCCEIMDGKHDDVPEDAFYMIGTIEQALEKAK